MKAFTYIKKGEFAFVEKAKPTIKDDKDAIVRVTMSSICTSGSAYQAWFCASCRTWYYRGA